MKSMLLIILLSLSLIINNKWKCPYRKPQNVNDFVKHKMFFWHKLIIQFELQLNAEILSPTSASRMDYKMEEWNIWFCDLYLGIFYNAKDWCFQLKTTTKNRQKDYRLRSIKVAQYRAAADKTNQPRSTRLYQELNTAMKKKEEEEEKKKPKAP